MMFLTSIAKYGCEPDASGSTPAAHHPLVRGQQHQAHVCLIQFVLPVFGLVVLSRPADGREASVSPVAPPSGV